MTNWTSDKPNSSPVSAAVRGDDPAALTPFCDIYCLLFGPTRLHTIGCDMANGRDPILNKPIDDVLPERSLIREWVSGTPYEEVE